MIAFGQDVGAARREAMAAINAAIAGVRGAYVTPIPGQEMIYLAKEAEARAYVAAMPEPATLDGYPLLAAEVGLTAPTPRALADLWIAMSAQWRQVAAALEPLRLTAGARVTAATTPPAVALALADLRAQLAALAGPTP